MKLPTERIVHQFENGCVIYTADHSQATGRVMPKLYVQSIDQYCYQREYNLGFRHEPGDSKKLYWESHIYQHPGRRSECKVSEEVAKRFILRFLDLCKNYPSLLFNKTGDHKENPARPRHEGFVHLAEILHRGVEPSVRLL
jgi:hypothetical protein